MKKHSYLKVLALVLITGVAFAIWYRAQTSNLASDEPPFNSIILPLKAVRGDIYMDGGSVWVGVEDSKGMSYDFIFPYDHKTQGYPTAFHGAKKPYEPGAVPLAEPARAREIVLDWLSHARGHDEGVDLAFDYLSWRNRSILRKMQRDGMRGIFN